MAAKPKPDTDTAPADPAETGGIRAAAEKRKAAQTGHAQPNTMLDALFDERRGYVTRGGMDDRVAQVDVQIRRLGGTPPTE